ncbi:hypothetical protein, partial [Enterococcus faecium]|uniref:hypothetical protein n=1 Tax=Enterococcus faecium TaxID=1352 RepID=UPI001E4C04C7
TSETLEVRKLESKIKLTEVRNNLETFSKNIKPAKLFAGFFICYILNSRSLTNPSIEFIFKNRIRKQHNLYLIK